MRIVIGSLQCEGNSLTPIHTRLEDFDYAVGEAMYEKVQVADFFQEKGCEIVPTIYAHALPGGAVVKEDFLRLAKELVDAIPVEGIDEPYMGPSIVVTHETDPKTARQCAEMLAFILKEDDFMWCKMGELKPGVEAPVYTSLTEEQTLATEHIAKLLKERFTAGYGQRDNAFQFLEKYQQPAAEDEVLVEPVSDKLRMVYPYFALYGDALIDDSIDPLPEGLLAEYAKAGVNGIWIQLVLYQMIEFPFEPSISKGWQDSLPLRCPRI